MQLVHFAGSDMRVGTCMSITSTFGDTVHSKMLQRCSNSLRLDTCHHFLAQCGYMKRFFTVTFKYAPPARIACQVQNRSIYISVTQSFSFTAYNLSRLSDKSSIPGGADGNRSRKRSRAVVIESMNPLVAEINRNAKACFFNKPALHCINGFSMLTERVGILSFYKSIEMFVDIGNAIFP